MRVTTWRLTQNFIYGLSFLTRHSPSNCIEPSQQLLQDAVCSRHLQMLEHVRPWPWQRLPSNLWAFSDDLVWPPAFESLISHQKHSFGITNNHVKLFRSGLLLLSYCEALRCSTCSLCTFSTSSQDCNCLFSTKHGLQTNQTRTVMECNIETITRDPKGV